MYVALLLSKTINESFGIENAISRVRRRLNDNALFPLTTPRLYLYSEGDAMVDFRDVHDHVEEARLQGCTVVREEKFLKAPHCAMLTEDQSRYWNAVRAHILNIDNNAKGK